MLHRLYEITEKHKTWVKDHEHRRIYSELFNFCTNDLSAFYFDIRKDALYCDPLNSTRRRACRTVMHHIFERLTTWLAPILCFTMEEVWQTRNDSSVHLEEYRDAPDAWEDESLAGHMTVLQDFRASVQEAIEPLRKEGVIGSSLETKILAPLDGILEAALYNAQVNYSNYDGSKTEGYTNPIEPRDTLSDYLIVSACELSLPSGDEPISVIDLKKASDFRKCERSWKYFKPEGNEDITPRDAAAVAALSN